MSDLLGVIGILTFGIGIAMGFKDTVNVYGRHAIRKNFDDLDINTFKDMVPETL